MKLKQALLHNTGWKMIAMLFTFLNNIVIVRILGVVISGDFFYALIIFAFVSTLLRLGLEKGIIYITSKFPKKTKAVIAFLFPLIIFQTLITFILLKFFIKETFSFNIFWAVNYIMCNVIFYYIAAFYQVRKRFISLNISNLLLIISQTIFIWFFYFKGFTVFKFSGVANNIIDSLMIVLSGSILLQVLGLIIYFNFSEKIDFKNIHLNSQTNKDLINFSLLNFTGGVLFFLVLRTDLYFVEKYCNNIIFSNYIQVVKLGQILLILPGQISGVIFPYSVNTTADFEEKINFIGRFLTSLYLSIYLFFLFFGKYLLVLMFGKEFMFIYPGMATTIPGVYFLAMNLIIGAYFEGKNLQKNILVVNVVTLIIIMLGDCLFVPHFGYISAGIIFSFANFIGLFVTFYYLKKITVTPIKNIFILNKKDLKHLKIIFKSNI